MDLQKAKDECDKVLDGGAAEVKPIHTPTARKSASPEREGSPAEKSTVRQLSHEFDRVAGEREEQNQSIPPIATPLRNMMNELGSGTPPTPLPRDGWGNGEISSMETLPLTPSLHQKDHDELDDAYPAIPEAKLRYILYVFFVFLLKKTSQVSPVPHVNWPLAKEEDEQTVPPTVESPEIPATQPDTWYAVSSRERISSVQGLQ